MILKNKKAAMEMSVGTIVTIVLLMTVLILGLVLVRTIFSTSKSSIDQIDQAVQNEINKLFAEEGKKIVIYPTSRDIILKKGDSGGFGFSIKNTESTDGSFSYEVKAIEVSSNCGMTMGQADNLVILGKKGSNINVPSGSSLENAILVKYEIPESAKICKIRYGLDVSKDGSIYIPTLSVDLEIE
jgi:hypothetical protein